ncbi:MAG: hypothetical protein ABI901_07140, partial [Roseiflexaceae bacterium]
CGSFVRAVFVWQAKTARTKGEKSVACVSTKQEGRSIERPSQGIHCSRCMIVMFNRAPLVQRRQ